MSLPDTAAAVVAFGAFLFVVLTLAAAPLLIHAWWADLGPVFVIAFLAYVATAVGPANFGTFGRR
jgi:hypothetical protein